MAFDSLVFAFGFGASSFLLFVIGLTIMVLVARTRVQHPALKSYLLLLAVILAHWLISVTVHFVGNLQLNPATIPDLLQFPGSAPWIAAVSLPERLLLAWEAVLILLCGRLATKTLGGRRGMRLLAWAAVPIFVFFGAERVVNLFFYQADPARSALELRAFWYSAGNLLTLITTAVTTFRLIRSRKKALFDYIGSSYRSLGWALATYLLLIFGLAVIGLMPGNLLGALSQSVWYLLVVSVLLSVLGLWNLVVGLRILTRSLDARSNKALHQQDSLSRFGLTEREKEIVWLLAQGLVNKEVAERLFVAESTVKNHIYNLYRKLGISNRAGLLKVLRDATATLNPAS